MKVTQLIPSLVWSNVVWSSGAMMNKMSNVLEHEETLTVIGVQVQKFIIIIMVVCVLWYGCSMYFPSMKCAYDYG